MAVYSQDAESDDNTAFELARTQPWVVVTGLFPHREQLAKYRVALHTNDDVPDYLMLRVERRAKRADGTYTEWASIDYRRMYDDVIRRLPANRWWPEKPDLVRAGAVFSGLVMRLPQLIEGEWRHVDRDEAIEAARRTFERRTESADSAEPTNVELQEAANRALFGAGTSGPAGGGRGMGAMAGGMGASGMGMSGGMGMGMGAMAGEDEVADMGAMADRMGAGGYGSRRQRSDAELLLVRFVDYTAEPGRTYQYRMKVSVRNPNSRRSDVVDEAATRPDRLESAAWSEPTADAVVPSIERDGAAVRFFGIEDSAVSVVYVIDRSGSMTQHDAFNKVRRELLDSIHRLSPESQFQVVFYNLRPTTLSWGQREVRRLVPPTEKEKEHAASWIISSTAAGGTEHLPALRTALALRPRSSTSSPTRTTFSPAT